jgi:hypothetical protein
VSEVEEGELNSIAVQRFGKQLTSLDKEEMKLVRHLRTWQKFVQWMDEHDTGPRSVTVGQIGREFEFRYLSFQVIGTWMRHYRNSKNGKAEA